jgi:hypothetical protein
MPIAAVALFVALAGAGQAAPAAARAAEAMEQIRKIVNKPARAYPRQPDVSIWVYRPAWFHEGALVPDFGTVDVRQTQTFDYGAHEWVSSDVNPTQMWRGEDLEFNSMTKYFYTDRNLPKRRLTEAEMLEINRLCRIVAESPPEPPTVRSTPPPPTRIVNPPVERAPGVPTTAIGSAVAVLLLLVALWLVRRGRAAGGR